MIILSASYIDVRYQTGAARLSSGIYSPISNTPKRLGYILLDLTTGTFTRSSSGSYFNGSTSSIAWANPDVLRFEDRGDGYGAVALFEGSRTNVSAYSEDIGNANWSKVNAGISGAQNSLVAPDGGMTAEYLTASNTNGRASITITQAVWGNDITGSISSWVYFPPGKTGTDLELNITHQDKTPTQNAYGLTGSAGIWKRFDFTKSSASGSGTGQIIGTGKVTGITTANTWSAWGQQIEVDADFPTSYISTSNGSATRAVDVLTFASGTYPPNLIGSGSLEFDIYPYATSVEAGNSPAQALFGFDTNNYVRISNIANIPRVMVIDGANIRLNQVVSWANRHQKLTFRLISNSTNTQWISASLSGFTSGDGTYALTVPVDYTDRISVLPLQIGNVAGNNVPFFGRISNFRRVVE